MEIAQAFDGFLQELHPSGKGHWQHLVLDKAVQSALGMRKGEYKQR
jgi:hypothetical protein